MKVVAVVAVATVFALSAADVARSDPPYLPWVSLLPTIAAPEDPTSTNPCRNGSAECVDRTIREMQRAFAGLASSCSHDSLFSLVYLRVTEEYDRTVDADSGFFANTPFVNNEDAVFAGYYFSAYDDWYAGSPERVPPAWRVAFRAADAHEVSGIGDLMLGINAHVNRDLPFALAALGLFNADGSSRKPDHDRVNVILNRVEGAVLTEAARRFDPSIVDPSVDPTGLTSTALFQLLEAWRENAWRNGELLASASTPQQWNARAGLIENAALLQAKAIELQYAYHPPLTTTTARDSYCQAHQSDSTP
jgi:hypothetical protein